MARTTMASRNSLSTLAKGSCGLVLSLGLVACANAGLAPKSVQPGPTCSSSTTLHNAGWHLATDNFGTTTPVSMWALSGAPVDLAGHTKTDQPLFSSIVSPGKDGPPLAVRTSAQLQCYAREQSAFWEQHTQAPTEVLERYMAAACGLWGYRPVVAHKVLALSGKDQVRREFRNAMRQLPDSGMVGVNARASSPGKVVLTLVYDAKPMQFVPTPTVLPGGGTLQLTLPPSSTKISQGIVTQGPHDWSECDVSDALNRTHARCKYSTDDAISFIDLTPAPNDSAPSAPFRAAAFGSQGVLLAYPASPRATSRVKHSVADSSNLMQAVNEARRRAGTFWVASDSQLGLMLDEWWRKPERGEIRDAFFGSSGNYHRSMIPLRPLELASFRSPSGLSAGEAINQALEIPRARSVILSARVGRIAVRQYKVEGQNQIETVIVATRDF